jgi:twitching motility protein PilU
VVTQREVGVDTRSYGEALKNALRQRPDVILIGEIRDREVMEQALISSETGHLCLATLHTTNAYQTIERVVNFFPEEYAHQIRMSLSLSLRAVISQRLLPCEQGGLIPAVEIMLNEGLVRELIYKGEIGKIKDVIEQNNTIGMCSFDQSLLMLYSAGHISEEVALAYADRETDMKVKLQKAHFSENRNGNTESLLRRMDTSRISLAE